MIVCVCLGVSDLEIENAIKTDTLAQLFQKKRPGSVCGSCMPEINEMIKFSHSDEQIDEDW